LGEIILDTRELRNCMGRFATGVTVVTCETEGEKHGFTANSFTSVSLDPPLVLVSVDRKIKAYELLKDNKFTVNILREDQQDIAMHFAGRPQGKLPFEWEKGKNGDRLQNALAYVECEPWAAYDGGDHVLYVGKVNHFEYSEGNPLGYYCGKFSKVSPL
jgi:flavin reductase (DIM6/NTAB) family NADH-FMN oxidoreductase RutF